MGTMIRAGSSYRATTEEKAAFERILIPAIRRRAIWRARGTRCLSRRQDYIQECYLEGWRRALKEWERGDCPTMYPALFARRVCAQVRSWAAMRSLIHYTEEEGATTARTSNVRVPFSLLAGDDAERNICGRVSSRAPRLSPADRAALLLDWQAWRATLEHWERMLIGGYYLGLSHARLRLLCPRSNNSPKYHRARLAAAWSTYR